LQSPSDRNELLDELNLFCSEEAGAASAMTGMEEDISAVSDQGIADWKSRLLEKQLLIETIDRDDIESTESIIR
jgi:hypothetical protein